MSSITKTVASWNAAQWQSNLKHARPSSGGAVGVMFCWTRSPGSDGPDYNRVATADFVLKPVPASGAPARFGDEMLARLQGAVSIRPEVLRAGTPQFAAAKAALLAHRQRLDASLRYADERPGRMIVRGFGLHAKVRMVPTSKYWVTQSQRDLAGKWDQVWKYYDTAGSFLIQDVVVGLREFGDEVHAGGIERLLLDRQIMANLGKLFAADAVLGIGDRLGFYNSGNIVFENQHHRMIAIDSEAILVNFRSFVDHSKMQAHSLSAQVLAWVEQHVDARGVGGRLPTGKEGETTPSSFSLNDLADPMGWWRRMFVPAIKASYDRDPELAQRFPFPGPDVWGRGYAHFRAGVDEGLQTIDRALVGLDWIKVKRLFQNYVAQYGADPNLDWTSLKLRRKYVQALLAENRRPGDPAAKAQRVLAVVLAYGNRKYAST